MSEFIQQCVLLEHRCDKIFHCLDLSDELLCDNLRSGYSDISFIKSVKLTYFVGQRMFVSIDDLGTLAPQNVSDDFPCPLTHFWCSDDTYCLPVFLRCNNIYDCPNHEDEAGCDTYTCPGHYRCRGSNVCVNPIYVCDGVFQCPQKDDELMCGFNCTHSCACYGNAFFCRDVFPAGEFPELRFLDGRDSGLTPADLVDNTLLVHLSLARCGLTSLSHMTHQNLLFFDLSDNKLRKITLDHIVGVEQLRELVLSGNPLASTFVAITGNFSLPSLSVLDLSRVIIKTIDVEMLRGFPNIETLNISKSGVDVMLGKGLRPLTQLRVLDARGCPMTQFPRDIFLGLEHLETVRGDNYKLCCPATLPVGFNVANCQAPEDEISSCETLLRSETYRIFLSLFAASSLLGNAGSLVYRVLVSKNVGKTTFGIFVVHLCVADFLMGVYLTVIGVADRLFMGTYLWNGLTWTRSPGCRTAGFLSLLSSEVSVSFIGLITLDRFIVIRCPFTTRRFRPWSAHVASGAVWLFGIVLAAVPLLPVTAHWNFYGQTGICIPLPITRRVFPGQKYSFGVMIIFNLFLFLLIGSGQGLIYKSILGSRMGLSDTSNASQDLAIARRLFAVVVSDFLCWFPIGLLGLLASNGVSIPGEVTVAIAIFVLPVNSALNPFLYTLNILLEKKRRLKEDRLQQRLVAELSDKDLLD